MLIWIYISWDLMCLNDCHQPAPPLSWISGDHLKNGPISPGGRGGGEGCKVARHTANQTELHLHSRGIDGGDEQLCLFHLARIRGYPPPHPPPTLSDVNQLFACDTCFKNVCRSTRRQVCEMKCKLADRLTLMETEYVLKLQLSPPL